MLFHTAFGNFFWRLVFDYYILSKHWPKMTISLPPTLFQVSYGRAVGPIHRASRKATVHNNSPNQIRNARILCVNLKHAVHLVQFLAHPTSVHMRNATPKGVWKGASAKFHIFWKMATIRFVPGGVILALHPLFLYIHLFIICLCTPSLIYLFISPSTYVLKTLKLVTVSVFSLLCR